MVRAPGNEDGGDGEDGEDGEEIRFSDAPGVTDVDSSHLPDDMTDATGTIDLSTPLDPVECTECGAEFESERGMKSHRGQVHPEWDADQNDDDDGDEDSDAGTADAGENGDGDGQDQVILTEDMLPDDDDDGQDLTERADARERSMRTAADLWDDAREAYELSSVTAYDVTRRDARGVAIDALTEETDYISVKRRSDESHEDLWRWTESSGWEDDGFSYVNTRMRSELGSAISTTDVREAVKHIAAVNKIEEGELNAGEFDETLVPVANGVISIDDVGYDADSMTVDWTGVELRNMRQEYYFTYRFDAAWDPDAADLSGLDEWLERVTTSDSDRRVIWEFAGHALHDRYPVDGFLELLGDGGSGKSQVLEVIKAMLGDEHTTPVSISDMEGDRFVGVHVADARANINTELSGTKLPSIDKLKTLTAGEELWVQKKGIDGYFTRNDATMMFSSDDPPAFPTRNDALGRRLYPVEFPFQFVDSPDPANPFELQSRPKLEVQEELQSDDRLSAALIRAVEGLVRLLNEGNFTDPRSRQARIEAHEAFADPILDFKRVCLVDAGPDSQIESGVLKATFNAFAEAKDHDGKTLQQITDILGGTTGISFSKGRTRSWSDEQSKHTVYTGIRFSAEALKSFVPEHALDKLDTSELDDDDDDTRPTAIDDHDDDEDGESEVDTEAIDRAVIQNADETESVGELAGRVSGTVKCNDLAMIKERIQQLSESGEVNSSDDGDEDTGSDIGPKRRLQRRSKHDDVHGSRHVGAREVAPADDVPDDIARVLVNSVVKFNEFDRGGTYSMPTIGPVAGKCVSRALIARRLHGSVIDAPVTQIESWVDRLIVDGVLAFDDGSRVFVPGSVQSEGRNDVPAEPIEVNIVDVGNGGEE